MSQLKILFLAPRVPWPLDTGGKIRTYYLLRALSRHHDIHFLSFRDPLAGDDGVRRIRDLGVLYDLFDPPGPVSRSVQMALGVVGPLPANMRKYQSDALACRVRALSHQGMADLVHCDHIHMAPYGDMAGLPFVVDEHNVESLIWDRFSRDRSEPIHRRLAFWQQGLLLRRVEARLAARAALVLTCSEADEQALCGLSPSHHPRTRVVPNGVDVDYFAEPGRAELSGHVFFTGSMDWAPNENAVINFLNEAWPVIKRELPSLRFAVVGRNPSARLRAMGGEGADVVVTGTVPDVRPFMRGAVALVVPMRVGGGTRLKILEAFAARVPVVSTGLGIEGIDAVPERHYLRADGAREFLAQIRRLQTSADLRQKLVEAAHELVCRRYSWDAIGGALAEEYARRFT